MDITTVDAIPVQSDPAERADGSGDATPDERAPKGKSLYDVTKASRERARDAARRRGAGSAADRRQGTARDLAQGRTTAAGRGGKPSGEPVSSNGVTGAGHADVAEAGLGLAAPGPGTPEPAGVGPAAPDLMAPDLAGQGRADEAAGDFAHQQQWNDAGAQEPGYPATAAPDRVDDAGERQAIQGQWAQDTDPGLDYSSDQDLDYTDDSGMDYTDDGRDYPADEGWDDVAGPGEPWANGLAGATGPGEDRGGDSGRSDVAGLDQLWGIGRGTSGCGQDQAPGAAGHQAGNVGDATGPGSPGDTGPGSMRGAAGSVPAPARGMGPGGAWDSVAATDDGASRETSLSRAREPGSAPDNGSVRSGGAARDIHPARDTSTRETGHGGENGHGGDNGHGRENGREDGSAWEGSAWDSHPAYEAGSVQDTSPGPARDSRRDLPGDFGPDPLGSPGGRETADFLAAPPPSGSILTTAPRQETRTARPANVGTETIAAELAGWAAGELPGQASARLAAWAAIGGVPAPGYRRTDGSDVGPTGVATEPVR